MIDGEGVVDRWSRSATPVDLLQFVPVTRGSIELFGASAETFRAVLVNVRPEHHDQPGRARRSQHLPARVGPRGRY